MPLANLLLLIDDIASTLDDVAAMTQLAAKKTAGVLGDDLALNAQQVSGVQSDREFAVVWAVAKGSLINKAILVPAALLISSFANWAITPLLMLGGAFLCFEGAEKLLHKNARPADIPAQRDLPLSSAQEQDKIKGAIRTDFILSAEIIVITLGTIANASFSQQISVLVIVALAMTVGVYGLVAGIVKLDDAGLWLNQRPGVTLIGNMQRSLGAMLLGLAPRLMKTLSVLGMAAMFMVGGSILAHGLPGMSGIHHAVAECCTVIPLAGILLPIVLDGLLGLISGMLILTAINLCKPLLSRKY